MVFIMQRVAQVRQALSDASSRNELFESQLQAFTSEENRNSAFEAVRQVIRSDGVHGGENAFLDQLSRIMKP